MVKAAGKGVDLIPLSTGRSMKGIDLGSSNFRTIPVPKVIMPIGEGISGYEAGEIYACPQTLDSFTANLRWNAVRD